MPDLFQVIGAGIPGWEVTHLPVKQAVMALPDPKKTAPDNWTTYCVITGHLVAALRGQEEFSTAYHNSYLKEGRVGVRKRNAKQLEEALVDNLVGTLVQVERQLRRATKTGAWLTVQTSIVNRMELGAQEW